MSAKRIVGLTVALLGLLLNACELRPPSGATAPRPTPPTAPAIPPAAPTATTEAAQARSDIFLATFGNPQHRYELPGRVHATPAELSGTDVGRSLRVERGDGKTVLHLPLHPDEALWGFGQRMDAFNLRGHAFDVWAEDSWNRTDTSYFAIPWFVSSRGYGLFVNSTGRLKVDLGAAQPGEIRIEIPEDGAEVWAITGTPREIVARYTALVGRPQPVPDWTFQPWLSRNSFLSAYEVDRHLALMEKNGMKVGAVVLEAWEQHLHNFQFETNRYPNPAAWIKKLDQRGVHVICWTTASIWTGDPSYEQARDRGFLVRNADGSEYITRWLENGRKMDFRQTAARDWWRDLHRPLIELGVGGFKTDGGEHMPDPWFHNVHPYFYQRATLDAFAAAGRPGISFARSANPICAGNSTFWGGDQDAQWSNLAVVVRGGLAAAWSGFFYWSHDVGGYTSTPDRDLYLRWLQIGTFSPLMQLHGITPREPWHYDRETLDLVRGYFKVRERLQPYLVELAREAREQGRPMWRPLAWAFPADAGTWSIGDQFMLGDDLLVAPVLDTHQERTVYLPAGDWVDLWEGVARAGPTQFVQKAERAVIPVFARAESADRWRNLLRPVVRPPASPLRLELAGARNERGLVPDQRYLRAGQGETVAYRLVNASPVVAEGTMSLPLPPGFRGEPTHHAFRLEAGEAREMSFNLIPPPNLPPGSYAVQGLCRIGTLSAKTPKIHLVQSPAWKVLGPFAGGVGSAQPMDGRTPDLLARYRGRDDQDILWQDVPDDAKAADGFVDVGRLTARDGALTTYAYTTLSSPAARRMTLYAGSGDAMTVWLNGQPVLRREVYRNPERDEDTVDVLLRGGVNHLLVRISRSMSPHGFYLRLAEPER